MGEFFKAHFIDEPRVTDGRYIRWERGEELPSAYGISPGRLLQVAGQMRPRTEVCEYCGKKRDGTGGYVMLKFPVPGVRKRVPSQIRPDHCFHEHGTCAKYLFNRAPRLMYVGVHPGVHRDLPGHLNRWHGGIDTAEPHEHETMEKDPSQTPEKRLDMHPLSAELLPTAERVFFVLEGVIKADAVLSAGECVFDVPSVTLWPRDELVKFARRSLRDRPVYVVPDSDWGNPMVAFQAFEVREVLRQAGVHAQVAFPTATCGEMCSHTDERGMANPDHKRGVDDFLADGCSVDDLVIADREMSPGFHALALDLMARERSDRARTDVDVMRFLALHASPLTGAAAKGTEMMARYTGRSEPAIRNSVRRLLEEGALTTEHDLAYVNQRWLVKKHSDGRVRKRWDPKKKKRVPVQMSMGSGWVQHIEENGKRRHTYRVPLLTLRPDLRPVEVQPRPMLKVPDESVV